MAAVAIDVEFGLRIVGHKPPSLNPLAFAVVPAIAARLERCALPERGVFCSDDVPDGKVRYWQARRVRPITTDQGRVDSKAGRTLARIESAAKRG